MQEKVRKNFAFLMSPETGNGAKKTLKTSPFSSRPKTGNANKKNVENFAFFKSPETGNANKKLRLSNSRPKTKTAKKTSKIFANLSEKKR
jgi:hypothetical protein